MDSSSHIIMYHCIINNQQISCVTPIANKQLFVHTRAIEVSAATMRKAE